MLIESNNFLSILKNWFLNDFIFMEKITKIYLKNKCFMRL